MFLNKVLSVALSALFLLMLACDGPSSGTGAQQLTQRTKNRTLQDDPIFWDYAASSNMLQTEISRCAAEKSSSEKVKAMAGKAVDFHSRALRQLRKLVANQEHLQLPDSLSGADKRLVQEFNSLEGEEFNQRFRSFIISTHKSQLDRYEEALRRTEDQKTRQWLTNMRMHLLEELEQFMAQDSVQAIEQS